MTPPGDRDSARLRRLARRAAAKLRRRAEESEPPAPREADSAESAQDPQSLQARKQAADEVIAAELERLLHPRAMREADEAHLRRVEALLSFAEPRHLTHPMVRRLERNRLSLRPGLSFRSIMLEQSEARLLGVFRPAWLLDNKSRAYAFVDALGVPRPRSDRTVRSLEQIPQDSPVILKPVRSTGSKGVYAVYSPDRIQHLRDGREFDSWEAMREHARGLMSPGRAKPLPDRWLVEELILEDPRNQVPARDLKFYAFYGEVALIRESRREDVTKVRCWTPQGEPAETGHDREPDLAAAVGPTAQQIKFVESISAEIPAPFMRIDMLRGANDVVFGEFTPRPGHFDEFNDEWDRRFGESWVRAEGRIIEDVLAGKSFTAFADAVGKRP
jgi:hypothetical protein